MLLQFLDGFRQLLVLGVAVDVDEEIVFPRLALGRAALDLAHVDLEALEGLEDIEERAGFVLHGEHQ